MLYTGGMTQMYRQAARWRRQSREWTLRHPRTMGLLERIGCLRIERAAMARGVAVGLFVALTPTVGFQTLLMLVFCVLLRGNFIAAFAVSWISNPLTLTPLYLGYYVVGELVFEPVLYPLALFTDGAVGNGVLEAACFILGSLLVALPAAVAGYALSYWLGHLVALRRSP